MCPFGSFPKIRGPFGILKIQIKCQVECGFEREMLAIQMLGYLQGTVVIIIIDNKSELLENTSERGHEPKTRA